MRRLIGFFNWQFMLCLAAALLMFGFVVGVVGVVLDNADKDDRLNQQSRHIDTLIAQSEAREERAAEERRELVASQRAIQSDAKRIADRYDALIAWLQSRGIRVPVGLIAEQVDTDGDGDDDSGEVDRQAAAREQAAREQAERNSTANAGPDNPGDGGSDSGGGSGGGSDDSPGKSDGKGKSDEDHGNDKPKKDKPDNGKGKDK